MKTILHRTLADLLKSTGFARKSTTWYSEREDTVLVVHLQKSDWSKQYYINLGVWVKDLGWPIKLPPPVHKCQARQRLCSMTDEKLKAVLDLEDEATQEAQRAVALESAMRELGLPFLERCSSLAGLKREIESGELRHALVFKTLKDLLGIYSSSGD